MRRPGLSLVELCVVLGIIAILLALILPAVQAARESARKTQCTSNLRQMLIATESHHSAHRTLPSFFNGSPLKYPLREWDLFHMHSWRVPLLRYVEHSALADRVEFNALATDSKNQTVAQTIVPLYICPTGGDPSDMGRVAKHDSLSIAPGQRGESEFSYLARSDYDAMAGIQVLPDPFPQG